MKQSQQALARKNYSYMLPSNNFLNWSITKCCIIVL